MVGVAAVRTAPVILGQWLTYTPARTAAAALKLLVQQPDDDPDADLLKELSVEIDCHS